MNSISSHLLYCYDREGDPFLHSVVTCDEILVHYFVPETKRTSMERQHKDSSPPEKGEDYIFHRERYGQLFPRLKVSYSLIFWQNKPFVLNYEVDQSKVSASSTTMCVCIPQL
jgi:hypothetical protein